MIISFYSLPFIIFICQERISRLIVLVFVSSQAVVFVCHREVWQRKVAFLAGKRLLNLLNLVSLDVDVSSGLGADKMLPASSPEEENMD